MPATGYHLLQLAVGLTFMSTVLVLLRIVARLRTKIGFGPDDYWVFIATFLNMGYMSLIIRVGLLQGSAPTIETLLPSQLTTYLQFVYGAAALYVVIISFAKFSVLHLYIRIFGNNIKAGVIFVYVCQTVWMIICLCLNFFRCRPLRGSWDVLIPSRCVNFELIVITAESFNCALDIVMIILPLRVIGKLQLKTRQKVLLSAIFMLGGFVGVMAILRIVDTVRSNVMGAAIWVVSQVNVGICCACLPILRPILPRDTGVLNSLRGLLSSFRTTTRGSGRASDKPSELGPNSAPQSRRFPYRNVDRGTSGTSKSQLAESSNDGLDTKMEDLNDAYSMDRIVIRHDIEVSHGGNL